MSYQYPSQPQGGPPTYPPSYGAPPPNFGPPPNQAQFPPNQAHFPPNQAPPPNFAPPPPSNFPPGPPAQQAAPPQQAPVRQFPPAFSIYGKPFSNTSYIGEHQDRPIYSVTHHSGLTSNPDLILHRTPDSHSPALATANASGHFSSNSDIEIIGAPVGAIRLQHGSGWGEGTYSFELPVGNGPNTHAERFEWRHSTGQEVRHAEKHAHRGWKLVRLAGQGTTSDGKEVVAAWGENSRSVSKNGTFQFLGSGATGELGSLWEVVAVVSYLRVDQKVEERAAASSGGGGGGGGGGGA